MEGCDKFPNCPASEVAKEQYRIQSEVNKALNEIRGDQKALISEVQKVGVLVSDINHLVADFRDFRDQTRKAFDNIFSRMVKVEQEKATEIDLKTLRTEMQGKANAIDVKDMQKIGVGWLWEIARYAVFAIVAFIAAKVAIVQSMPMPK